MSFSEQYGDSEVKGDFSMLEKLVDELDTNYYVDVGILGSETDSESGLTIAGIGAVHEFGTDRAGRGNKTVIPKRSFIKMPIDKKQADIKSAAEKRLQQHLEKGNVKGVFEDIGLAAEGVIQEAFSTGGFGTWAPNAESTVQKKGSASPLIDEGVLRKAITSKVGS